MQQSLSLRQEDLTYLELDYQKGCYKPKDKFYYTNFTVKPLMIPGVNAPSKVRSELAPHPNISDISDTIHYSKVIDPINNLHETVKPHKTLKVNLIGGSSHNPSKLQISQKPQPFDSQLPLKNKSILNSKPFPITKNQD